MRRAWVLECVSAFNHSHWRQKDTKFKETLNSDARVQTFKVLISMCQQNQKEINTITSKMIQMIPDVGMMGPLIGFGINNEENSWGGTDGGQEASPFGRGMIICCDKEGGLKISLAGWSWVPRFPRVQGSWQRGRLTLCPACWSTPPGGICFSSCQAPILKWEEKED